MRADTVEARLLAAIAADPDATEPRYVYGDWLQAQGDPRGELIAVQTARAARPDDVELSAKEAALVRDLTAALIAQTADAPLDARMIKRWHLGFVDAITVGAREARLLRSTHRTWFAQPAFAAVRAVEIDSKFARNLRVVTQTQLAGTVRELAFGDPLLVLDDATLAAIARRLPRLRALALRCREVPPLGELQRLPLRELSLHVRELSRAGVTNLLAMSWRLERLTLRAERPLSEDDVAAITPIFDGTSFPRVEHFTIDGSIPLLDILEVAATSARAKTIKSVTASFHRCTDHELVRVERHREALAGVKFAPLLAGMPYFDANHHVTVGSFLNYRLQRPEDAIPHYEAALRLVPSLGTARHNLGIALRKVRRYDESLVAFDLLIQQSRSPTASMFNGRHLTLCELGRRDEARADLERALELDPNFADAWNNIGCERQYIGDAEGALAAFRRCMTLDPAHRFSRKNEADLLLELALPGEAMPIYLELLRERPTDRDLHAMLAYAQLELGAHELARATVDRQLADPRVERPYRLHIVRALARQALGDHDGARADLDTCAARTTNPSWYALATYARGLAAWRAAVPDRAVTPRELADAIAAHANAARIEAASVDDQLDLGELATMSALRTGDRELAMRRVRALLALYIEQGARYHRAWWQTLATVAQVTTRELATDARELLQQVLRTVRGRRPVATLLALVD